MRPGRRLAEWAARIYPRSWRRRYGAELDALLEDLDLSWRDVASLVQGGMAMRLTNPEPNAQKTKRRLAACLVVSCLFAALAFAAADDITTGSEPSFLGEWLMLAFVAVWFLAAGAWARNQTPMARGNTGLGPAALLVVLSCLVAAFTLAALVEIATGSRPGYRLEWLIVAFAAVWFLVAGAWARKQGPVTRAKTG